MRARPVRQSVPALLAFFVRLTPDETRHHPRRAQLLEALSHRRSASTPELVLALGINEGTLVYHLRVLERAGLVRSLRIGRDRVWSLTSLAPSDLRREAFLHPTERRILLEAVSTTPGRSLSALARDLELPKATVHRHVRHLVEAGLVLMRRDGSRQRFFPRTIENRRVGPHGAL